METLDFSISFGQNSLESISDRVFEYAFSRHPLLLPFSKSTFICSPVMGIYFLLALYRQFCSVLGFEGEQDMVLVHKEHLWMWGCGRRQTRRTRRTCEPLHGRHSPSSWCEDPDRSLPPFSPPGPFASVLSALPFWGTDLIAATMLIFVFLLPKE